MSKFENDVQWVPGEDITANHIPVKATAWRMPFHTHRTYGSDYVLAMNETGIQQINNLTNLKLI